MSSENLDALAALIRRERDFLLTEWRQEVRQLSVAHNLDVPTLNDHIPDLLEELACELEICSDESMIEGLKDNPIIHGLDRLRLGFDIEEVVAKYNALRSVIQNLIERHDLRHRELRRNSTRADGRYRAFTAQERTNGRRSRSRRNQRFTVKDFSLVDDLIRRQWSPEQVSRHLRRQGHLSISHETIYRHVWQDKCEGGLLYTHLRGARKRRRKRYGAYDSRGRLANKRRISERPSVVETRKQIGHREIDTVMGTGSLDCIVSLVERKTDLVLIGKLKDRTTASLNGRLSRLMKRQTGPFETITADNGTEFHDYKRIEDRTQVMFYFARPYHSWERGSNENANGLIRQYLPRGTSMARLSQHLCNAIARKLNTRPRKRLGFRTPLEAYNES